MLNSKAFANATTAVVTVLYIVCRILVAIMPNALFQIGQSWFHTIQLEAGQAAGSLSLGSFVLGLVSAAIITWITTYATIELYNRWAK